mgnify:CR=1 FL=1
MENRKRNKLDIMEMKKKKQTMLLFRELSDTRCQIAKEHDSEVNSNQTILEWYQQNNRFIDAPCAGKGDCGRCKIRFMSEAPIPQEKEKRLLKETELRMGVRLACVTKMQNDAHFEVIGDLFETEKIVVPVEETWQEKVEIDEREQLGIALDIGTTTLAMSLVRLSSGKCIKTVTAVNHQRSYGADVISRIQAENSGKGLELQECILKDIWNMLLEMLQLTGIKSGQIKKFAIAGNTTMCHLLLGYSCEGLGKAPFRPANLSLIKITTAELFKKLAFWIKTNAVYSNLNAEVVILPGISAFVGADIVAGMYACDMDLSEKTHMLLDIGTNGEMVIGNKDGFLVTATAAGPVFEGGNISCGMPAVKGSVSHVQCVSGFSGDGEKEFVWNCEMIGIEQQSEEMPKGICGSGLIDLAAALWKEGLIDENGTLIEKFFETGVLIKGLKITQADIRELQMGKAAIRAGIEILRQKMIPECIFLAGGFGTELDIDAANVIGLIPKGIDNDVFLKGNTSLLGLQKFLTDENAQMRVKNIVKLSEEIMLAEEGNFEEKYILFMQFLL